MIDLAKIFLNGLRLIVGINKRRQCQNACDIDIEVVEWHSICSRPAVRNGQSGVLNIGNSLIFRNKLHAERGRQAEEVCSVLNL